MPRLSTQIPKQGTGLDLPIAALLDDIRAHLATDNSLVLQAPPGAGKTTIVPLALLDEPWLAGRNILVLQPRRIAAKNAALRMATLLDERPGQTVGYRMRLDTQVGPETRIEVVTEGVLLGMLREDPALSNVGLLIFDEFHERSLDADLGLTLALQSRRTFGEEAAFKLIVMSATLAGSDLAGFLDCPLLISEGRLFPVAVRHGKAARAGERLIERVVEVAQDAIARHPDSSFLVFLPGQAEIRRVAQQLDVPAQVRVSSLFGDLSLQEQQRAIEAPPSGVQKLVLATNIAETSLTIEGVDVVIDSGLERVPVFDPNTGMSRLQTARISQASSEQRMGRAGRLREGHCYRLWSESQQAELQAQRAPEIENADLSSMSLQLFAWGVYDPSELAWLSAPGEGAYRQSLDLLKSLGALEATEEGHRLTRHGNAMASLPMHPRLAHMLLSGAASGVRDTAALLAAILSDRDPVSRESADMRTRLEYLSGETDCPPLFRAWAQRAQTLARDFLRQLPTSPASTLPRPSREQLIGYLLATAYPDRIARLRHSGGYQLANGRSCQFASPSSLGKHKWLAVAELSGVSGRRSDLIRSAAPLDFALFDSLLAAQLTDTSRVDWDAKSGRFVAERRQQCGALLVSRQTLDNVGDAARVEKLLELIRDSKLANLPWQGAAEDFRNRALAMSRVHDDWPNYDEAALIASADEWLAPFLMPVKKLAELQRIDLPGALKTRLSWAQQQCLDRDVPARIVVPSGSSIRIDYSQSPPVLAVKLQEMFGCETSPAVAQGRLPLTLHLLSPAGRPLQLTQDLASFWRDGYDAVKKEMRGRYPKHPWPDNPLLALPTAHTKKRRR
ncbi:MAG: ATP-dependent helicase HrpB [Congregibacter sp.]